MKKISLINPEQAKQIFSRHNWTDENNYFIKVDSVSSELLLVMACCSYRRCRLLCLQRDNVLYSREINSDKKKAGLSTSKFNDRYSFR